MPLREPRMPDGPVAPDNGPGDSRTKAKGPRQRLLRAVDLSHVTLFAVDRNRQLTLLEGALVRSRESRRYIGRNVYNVFSLLDPTPPSVPLPPFLQPLESVLSGKGGAERRKHKIRTYLIREPHV